MRLIYNSSKHLKKRPGPIDQSGRVPRTGNPIERHDAPWNAPGGLRDTIRIGIATFIFDKITGIPITRFQVGTVLLGYTTDLNSGEQDWINNINARSVACPGAGICSH